MAKSASRGLLGAIADQLRALGVRGVLVQMAERGQLLELRCEMPNCYCPKGRGYFEVKASPMPDWAPNSDHYPILKMAGGKLNAANVRLSHVRCNNNDYGWRTRIKTLLAKGKSMEEIADSLNRKKIPPPHGRNRWSARSVREAYVS
jgi:hypothetical protein